MAVIRYTFLLTEGEAAHIDPELKRRGQARRSAARIYISGLPTWRRRAGRWKAYVAVHAVAVTREDCLHAFQEVIDDLLWHGHLTLEHVPMPSVTFGPAGMLEVRHGGVPSCVEAATQTDDRRPRAGDWLCPVCGSMNFTNAWACRGACGCSVDQDGVLFFSCLPREYWSWFIAGHSMRQQFEGISPPPGL